MKRIFLLFLMCYTFSYSSYLISNSEIVLFYDKSFNSIHFVKGDIFRPTDISRIEGKLIIDSSEIISMNNYFKSASILEKGNMLQLTYSIQGKDITVTFIPSEVDREKLYVIADFKNIILDKKIDFVFHIIPQQDNGNIEYIPKSNAFSYGDNIFFKSENYGGRTFVTRDNIIENFVMEEVVEKTKKYQDDNLYYLVSDVRKDEPVVFTLKFFNDFPDAAGVSAASIIKEESRWNSRNIMDAVVGEKYGAVAQELIKQLRTITSRAVIPDAISYNLSKENLTNKIKLFYMCSRLQPDFDSAKMFVDLNTRRTETESAAYYTYVFRYLNDIGKSFNSEYFKWKIEPEVLSMIDSIEDSGEIFDGRDNIYNYYTQYKLVELISKIAAFSNEKEYIEGKKQLLYNFIIKNYTLSDGIKTRRGDSRSSYKNIAYIDLLPKEKQKKIVLSDYKKYYNKKIGVLTGEDKNRVDMEYNLEFAVKLYENDFVQQGNQLMKNLEKLIAENNYYLNPVIKLDEENPAGIYGEPLYLYLKAVQYREKHNEHTK